MLNGVNVTQLQATIESISQNATLADFRFSALNEWHTCGHSTISIKSFYGVNETPE